MESPCLYKEKGLSKGFSPNLEFSLSAEKIQAMYAEVPAPENVDPNTLVSASTGSQLEHLSSSAEFENGEIIRRERTRTRNRDIESAAGQLAEAANIPPQEEINEVQSEIQQNPEGAGLTLTQSCNEIRIALQVPTDSLQQAGLPINGQMNFSFSYKLLDKYTLAYEEDMPLIPGIPEGQSLGDGITNGVNKREIFTLVPFADESTVLLPRAYAQVYLEDRVTLRSNVAETSDHINTKLKIRQALVDPQWAGLSFVGIVPDNMAGALSINRLLPRDIE